MSITDELREWFKDRFFMANGWQEINAIADRIDAAHEEALGSKVAMAISVGEDGTEFVSMPAKELSERYVELPKDADGEVIHVGDKLDDGWRALQGEVRELILNHDGWWFRFKDNCEQFYVHEFHEWHHRHAPTVEDVLHDFICDLEEGVRDEVDLIAEYAAKLRLTDNGKEQ